MCVSVRVFYHTNELKVSRFAKNKEAKRERNRTFPRQRESRTLVSSEGPPEKPEQKKTHTCEHIIDKKTNKICVFHYENLLGFHQMG